MKPLYGFKAGTYSAVISVINCKQHIYSFRIETPAIRKILKWLMMNTVAIGLYYLIGHWALLFPLIMLTTGTIYHFIWCRKNGIDPLKATPKRKYYELRKWNWIE